MRSKEDAHDYRYFPDPDLLPLEITRDWVESVKADMPELPDARKLRFMSHSEEALKAALTEREADEEFDRKLAGWVESAYNQLIYGLPEAAADFLVCDRQIGDYFEEAVQVAGHANARMCANWVMGDLAARLNREEKDITDSPVTAAQLGGLIARIADNTISNNIAKKVFDALWGGEGETADAIIDKQGLKQITDSGAIEKIIDEVLAANPKSVEEFRAGKEKAFNALVGQAMKATKGKANPQQVNELLRAKLGS